jgi:16S rRNA processing protein RimM
MSDSARRNSRPRKRTSSLYTHRNRRVYVPEGHFAVGQISGVHGLKGEVTVELHTDFPERFAPGAQLLLGDDLEPVTVATSRPHKNNALVRFEGVNDRTQAESLRGLWIYIHEDEAAVLEEDTYWIHDIIGLDVYSDEGRFLGEITDVMPTGSNDVYILKTPSNVNRGQELLLPAIAEVVLEVDLAARRMTVHLVAGLLDESGNDESAAEN